MTVVWWARFGVLGVAALNGTSYTFTKTLVEAGMPPGLIVTLQFAIASLVTLPFLLLQTSQSSFTTTTTPQNPAHTKTLKEEKGSAKEKNKGKNEKKTEAAAVAEKGTQDDKCTQKQKTQQCQAFQAFRTGMLMGLFDGMGYLAEAAALQYTQASRAAFYCSLTVIVVPIVDRVFSSSSSSKLPAPSSCCHAQFLGAGLAFLGVWLLSMSSEGEEEEEEEEEEEGYNNGDVCNDPSWAVSRMRLGDAIALIQPIAFGFGFWVTEEASRQYPQNSEHVAGGMLFSVLVAALGCTLAMEMDTITDYTLWQVWLSSSSVYVSLLWNGALATALSYHLETAALRFVSATEVAVLFTSEPLWGSLFALVMLGDRLGSTSHTGMLQALTAAALILVGCCTTAVATAKDDDDDDDNDDDNDDNDNMNENHEKDSGENDRHAKEADLAKEQQFCLIDFFFFEVNLLSHVEMFCH